MDYQTILMILRVGIEIDIAQKEMLPTFMRSHLSMGQSTCQ